MKKQLISLLFFMVCTFAATAQNNQKEIAEFDILEGFFSDDLASGSGFLGMLIGLDVDDSNPLEYLKNRNVIAAIRINDYRKNDNILSLIIYDERHTKKLFSQDFRSHIDYNQNTGFSIQNDDYTMVVDKNKMGIYEFNLLGYNKESKKLSHTWKITPSSNKKEKIWVNQLAKAFYLEFFLWEKIAEELKNGGIYKNQMSLLQKDFPNVITSKFKEDLEEIYKRKTAELSTNNKSIKTNNTKQNTPKPNTSNSSSKPSTSTSSTNSTQQNNPVVTTNATTEISAKYRGIRMFFANNDNFIPNKTTSNDFSAYDLSTKVLGIINNPSVKMNIEDIVSSLLSYIPNLKMVQRNSMVYDFKNMEISCNGKNLIYHIKFNTDYSLKSFDYSAYFQTKEEAIAYMKKIQAELESKNITFIIDEKRAAIFTDYHYYPNSISISVNKNNNKDVSKMKYVLCWACYYRNVL